LKFCSLFNNDSKNFKKSVRSVPHVAYIVAHCRGNQHDEHKMIRICVNSIYRNLIIDVIFESKIYLQNCSVQYFPVLRSK